MIRVSAGTACVLGLSGIRADEPPTTGYLMAGERCAFDCAFCPQARGSTSPSGYLSRVTWPAFELEEVARRLGEAYREGRLQRACIQVVFNPKTLAGLERAVRAIKEAAPVPLCLSTHLARAEDALRLADWGADRIGLPLDAAAENVYSVVKGGSWSRALEVLTGAASLLPGRVSTHLIAGLGETERDLSHMFQFCRDAGITVGLFAFTPVRGTPLSGRPQPDIRSYRRVQAALHLIRQGRARAESFRYADHGKIAGFGMPAEELVAVLEDGEAFRTAGCPDCNRPYYNERPGRLTYNYPRPLTAAEASQAVAEVIGATTCNGG